MGDVVERKRYSCDDHTYGPTGYVAWHEWAEKKSETHRNVRCHECGLYAIWLPKEDEHG